MQPPRSGQAGGQTDGSGSQQGADFNLALRDAANDNATVFIPAAERRRAALADFRPGAGPAQGALCRPFRGNHFSHGPAQIGQGGFQSGADGGEIRLWTQQQQKRGRPGPHFQHAGLPQGQIARRSAPGGVGQNRVAQPRPAFHHMRHIRAFQSLFHDISLTFAPLPENRRPTRRTRRVR